ncbi:MAG: carboxypeptidase regulatory-like domain-containing protein [Planctomycetota bacterium]|nr:carboxypeptidase regulatory-like domain-containing protein [Planctomycetota bacterium]
MRVVLIAVGLLAVVLLAGAPLWLLLSEDTDEPFGGDEPAADVQTGGLTAIGDGNHVESDAPTPARPAENGPATVVHRGEVRTEDGSPMRDARVTLTRDGQVVEGVTDAEGRFAVEAVAGTHDLRITAPDGRLIHTGAVVVDGAPAAPHRAPRGTPLRMRLLQADEPAIGLRVRVLRNDHEELVLTSGADGRVHAGNVTVGALVLEVALPGGGVTVSFEHDHQSDHERVLAWPGLVRVAGTVGIGLEGAGVAGARVTIRARQREGPAVTADVVSGVDGRFEVHAPKVWDAWPIVEARAEGFADWYGAWHTPAKPKERRTEHARAIQPIRRAFMGYANDNTARIPLRRFEGPSVRGRLVAANGNPVGRVPVELVIHKHFDPAVRVDITMADADGHFSFPTVRPRTMLRIRVAGPRWHGSSEIFRVPWNQVETIELKVPVDGERAFAGVVVGPDGEPVPGALVWLAMPVPGHLKPLKPGDPRRREVLTDAAGRFAIHAFHTRRACPLRAAWGTLQATPVRVRPGPDVEVRLVLKPAPWIEGRLVERGTGIPIRDALIRVQSIHGDGRTAEVPDGQVPFVLRTDADGSFKSHPLLPGVWEMRVVWGRGWAESPWTKLDLSEVTGAHRIEREVDPGRFVGGRVVDADGRGLVGQVVVREGRVAHRTASDATGAFRVSGLGDGPFLVQVKVPGRGAAWQQDIEPGTSDLELVVK